MFVEDKKSFNKINLMFVLSRILVIFILAGTCEIFGYDLLSILDNFDSEHYLNISTYGYRDSREYAFFPLFPIILNIFGRLGFKNVFGIIFNNILAYLVGIFLYKMSKDIYKKDENVAIFSAILWFYSPIAIYTSVLYTESLFCFLTLLALYFYKTNRNPILTGIVLGLSVMTRSSGSMLFFSIAICLGLEIIKRFKNKIEYKERLVYAIKMYIPATLISCIYPVYLQLTLGNWKYFVDVQYDHWLKVKSNLFYAMYLDIKHFKEGLTFNYPELIMQSISGWLAFLFIIYLMYKIFKKKEIFKYKEVLLYSIFALLAIFSTARTWGSPLTSYFRYIYALISVYLMAGNYKINYVVIFVNIFILIIVSMSFVLRLFMY